MTPLKPDTVEKTLREKPHQYMWYQDTLNVYETMLVGPFDFIDGYKIPHHAWEALRKKAPGRKVYAGDVEESSRYRELILGTPPATRRCWHTLNSNGQYLPLSSTSYLVSSLSMMLFYDSFSATVTSPVLFVPPT
jgi:hypothetical protein